MKLGQFIASMKGLHIAADEIQVRVVRVEAGGAHLEFSFWEKNKAIYTFAATYLNEGDALSVAPVKVKVPVTVDMEAP